MYVRSTDPSRADLWQVSAGGGRTPRWSRDGRELFYIGGDSLMASEVTTGAGFTVRSRRALFSMDRFEQGLGAVAYDVLPGGDFLMLEKRDAGSARARVVYVDQWRALLAAAKAHQ